MKCHPAVAIWPSWGYASPMGTSYLECRHFLSHPASSDHSFWGRADGKPSSRVEGKPGGLRPTWGDPAARSRAELPSRLPHLEAGEGWEGRSWRPGTSPLPILTAQEAPSGPGHLLPNWFEPSAAAMKAPPLPKPYIKRAGPKINLALLFVVDNTEGILCAGRERLFVWVRRQRRSVLADI